MQLFPTDDLSKTIVTQAGELAGAVVMPRKLDQERTELSKEQTSSLFFSDAAMIGIVSAMPGPRFCWHINHHFCTSFVNVPEDTIQMIVDKDGKATRHKKKSRGAIPSLFGENEADNSTSEGGSMEFSFPVYCHDKPGSNSRYLLYKLKSGGALLLPGEKNRRYDYLWLVQTADPEHDAHMVMDVLRQMPEIQVAQLLDAADMEKSRENLLL